MERNHVCLETAQKLKAAGFPQDSYAAWVIDPLDGEPYVRKFEHRFPAKGHVYIAAPNAEEIAAQIEGDIKLIREGATWCAHKPHDGGLGVGSGPSIAESLAQHWMMRQEVIRLREARQLNGEPKQ